MIYFKFILLMLAPQVIFMDPKFLFFDGKEKHPAGEQ